MNTWIVLCFIYLIPLSTSVSIVKENSDFGNKLTRQRRGCDIYTCTYDVCDGEISAAGCAAVGCIHYVSIGGPNSVAINKCIKWTGSGLCFPGTAMVTTPTGIVAMEKLNIGDSVLTVLANAEVGFTKVVGFAQRESDKEANYLSITAVNQNGHSHTVKLTATHNIYVKTKFANDKEEYTPRYADDVLIGDMLKTQTNNGAAVNEATVTHVILHKEMGAYAPLTETGTMLVDGTLVSCYASFNDYLVHIVTAPIRWFPWLFAEEEVLDGTLPYVSTIKYIARSYVAPIVSLN